MMKSTLHHALCIHIASYHGYIQEKTLSDSVDIQCLVCKTIHALSKLFQHI